MSKSFFLIIAIFTFLGSSFSYGQDAPFDATSHIKSYTIASPDIYNFEKYKLNPLNHYTGKSNVGVPVFTIVTGNITYPIGLKYDTGGIKVDQLASNVGLGWSLSKTIITRTVNQDNDFNNLGNNRMGNAGIDSSDPYYYTYETQVELDEELQAWLDGTGNVGYFLAKRKNIQMTSRNKNVDFLPDTYNFYTSNFSTSFFFDDPKTAVEISPNGTLINARIGKKVFDSHYGQIKVKNTKSGLYPLSNFYDFPTQDFFSITITTKDGIKYIFNDFDLSASYSMRQGKKYFAPPQISAWHVSQIIDTNTGKTITFEYDTTSTNPYQFTSGLPLNELERQFVLNAAQNSYNYTALPLLNQTGNTCNDYYFKEDRWTKNVNTSTRLDLQLKRLKSISFDEGKILFYYNGYIPQGQGTGGNREDIFNGDFLTTIQVSDKNNQLIKSFDLIYDYFESNMNVGEFNPNNFPNYNEFRYKRLKLTEFREVGKPAYKFTYNESNKLPPINSFSIDFLGYYNASKDVRNLEEIIVNRPNPQLFYYPNKYEYSLLPFAVSGSSYSTISGYFNRSANDFSNTWTLTSIKYPTGGETQFVYQSNDFEVFGKTIKGGGVRIASQLLIDDNGGTETVNYFYNKANGISSGRLSSIPFFGHPTKKFFNVTVSPSDPYVLIPQGTSTDVINWKLFDKSNLNEDIAIGAYVGYSRIIEKQIGNGYTEFIFTSNEVADNKNLIQRGEEFNPSQITIPGWIFGECLTNFLILNSGIGANIFSDNSYRRGKLLEENIFSESLTAAVKKTKFTYTNYQNGAFQFLQPITRPIESLNVDDNVRYLLTASKVFNISNYLPTNKIVTFTDGADEINVEEKFTYTDYGMIKTAVLKDSDNLEEQTTYYYPKDVINEYSLPGGVLTLDELNSVQAMKNISHNYIGIPLQIEEFSNGTIVSRKRSLFKSYTPLDRILPSTISSAVENNPLQNELEFHSFDYGAAKPVEVSVNGGPKNIYIWGYNKTKLIAKIDNVNYLDLPSATVTQLQALSDQEFSDSAEENLRTALSNLRQLFPNGFVTTYTYDPLVGVKSITDPRGNTIYYTYDALNRLKFVKDSEGNLLSKNEYNYKQ